MDTNERILRLAEFSSEIRKLTLERLQEVPEGFINWRLNNTAISFANIIQHLIEVDELFFNLAESKEKEFQWKLGSDEPHMQIDRTTYDALIKQLEEIETKRHRIISSFDDLKMNEIITKIDGEKMSFWWFIMTKVLEHEIYHRGQMAAYLKVLKGETSST